MDDIKITEVAMGGTYRPTIYRKNDNRGTKRPTEC